MPLFVENLKDTAAINVTMVIGVLLTITSHLLTITRAETNTPGNAGTFKDMPKIIKKYLAVSIKDSTFAHAILKRTATSAPLAQLVEQLTLNQWV